MPPVRPDRTSPSRRDRPLPSRSERASPSLSGPRPVGRLRRALPSGAQWRSLRGPLLASAASGAAMRLAYPGVEWGGAAFFALIPFLAALRGRSAGEGAWLGLAFGFPFFYLNLRWLEVLSFVNPFAPLGAAAGALYCALWFVLLGALTAAFLSRRPPAWQRIFFPPLLWTGLEYLRAQTELGFPWMYLGHTQVNFLPLIQVCDLAGVYGVSFLVALSNQSGAELWWARRTPGGKTAGLSALGATAVLAGLFLGYGAWRHSPSQGLDTSGPSPGGSPLLVALVQPGIPQPLKLASYTYADPERSKALQAEMNRAMGGRLAQLRGEALAAGRPPAQIYVLPESTVTHPYFDLFPQETGLVEEWARTVQAPVFLGANRYEPPPGVRDRSDPRFLEGGRMYNSAWLVDPEAGLTRPAYDKIHLVPFGEFGSYLDIIPGFTEYVLGIGNFAAGEDSVVFRAAGRSFGCAICFESCFPYLFRRAVNRGAEWMAVLTNDAWYGLSSGARRHQVQSVFRAIEMRRPVVRAANTGISCVINAWGRTTAELPLREGVALDLTAPIPFPEPAGGGAWPATAYMRPWGDWFAWGCLLAALGCFLPRLLLAGPDGRLRR